MVYLPLASQHLDVKTIGRGGPLQQLLKPDKGTPLFACLSTVAGRSGPAGRNVGQGCCRVSPRRICRRPPYGLHPATNAIRRCLSWVKSCPDNPEVQLPLYTRKRTQVGHRAMSEKCQIRKLTKTCRLPWAPSDSAVAIYAFCNSCIIPYMSDTV